MWVWGKCAVWWRENGLKLFLWFYTSLLLQWFLQDTVEGARDSEGHTLLKYRADFLYHRKQYSAAVAMFNHILEILPSTNALVRREVTDSLARCQLHLGEYSKALVYAKSLVGYTPLLPALHLSSPSTSCSCLVGYVYRFHRYFLHIVGTHRHGNW